MCDLTHLCLNIYFQKDRFNRITVEVNTKNAQNAIIQMELYLRKMFAHEIYIIYKSGTFKVPVQK